MSNVVDIRSRRTHSTGPAKCLHCGHEWIAIVDVGDWHFPCPECGLEKGIFQGLMMPANQPVYHCASCEGNLFMVRGDGFCFCVKCGSTQPCCDGASCR